MCSGCASGAHLVMESTGMVEDRKPEAGRAVRQILEETGWEGGNC